MFSRLSADISVLFRQEVQLAKAEATQSAKQAGTGAGMLVGAAIGGIFLLLFASVALMWALGSFYARGLGRTHCCWYLGDHRLDSGSSR